MSYSSASVSPICDYITLYFTDGTGENNDGSRTYDIPPAAFVSNQRGDYCSVSMVDGAVRTINNNENVLVCYDNVYNHGVVTDSTSYKPVIGNFSCVTGAANGDYFHEFIPNKVSYLTTPRPVQIKLFFIKQDGDATLPTDGYVTLKFEYITRNSVSETKEQTDYITFPEPPKF